MALFDIYNLCKSSYSVYWQIIVSALDSYFYDPDPVTRAAKLGPIQKEVVPFYIGKFEEILRNNNGLFVGSQVKQFWTYQCHFDPHI